MFTVHSSIEIVTLAHDFSIVFDLAIDQKRKESNQINAIRQCLEIYKLIFMYYGLILIFRKEN